MENNKQMKLYYPGCKEKNKQMKFYFPGCMDNKKKTNGAIFPCVHGK
jgi:hypothetical protein